MLFGNKDNFAIEAYSEDDLTVPSAVWGRTCIWCSGEMVGDIQERCCALYTSANGFRWRAQNLDALWDESFDGLAADEVFNVFDRAIYVYEEGATEDIAADADRYWKFVFLTNWGEQFDPVKGFLAAQPGKEVLVIIQRPDATLLTSRIDRDWFCRTALGFAEWFDSEEQRLQPNRAD